MQERNYLVDLFITSVPPFNFQQSIDNLLREALLDWLGWISSYNCARLYIFNDYRFGRHNTALANSYAAHNCTAFTNPYIIFNYHMSFRCWMSVSIDLPCRKFIVEDVTKGERCGPVDSMVSPKENRLVASDRAETSNEQVCSFAPASYRNILNTISVPACGKYLALLSSLQWFH